MDVKSKTGRIIILSAVFCLLYIILALRPTGTELHFTPEWTVSIADAPSETEQDCIPFRLGQDAGYFTEDGKIAYAVSFPYKAAVSENYIAPFSPDAAETKFYSPKGNELGVIKSEGFPFFEEDRIFVFIPGGSTFIKCDVNGNEFWRYEYYAPITAFSSSKEAFLAGYADGRMIAFDPRGNILQDFVAEGCTYPVILGAGISYDGTTAACISGHEPQRFIVSKKEENHSKIIFHAQLKNETYEQQPVKFSRDGKSIFYGCSGGIGIAIPEDRKNIIIPLEGLISQIEESPAENFFYILSRSGDTCTVTIIEDSQNKAAEFSFKAQHAFIKAKGTKLFVGRDKKISAITVSRK